MEFVRPYSHLGHRLLDDFDDANINRGRVKLISQINSVLFIFVKLIALYGCVFSPHTVTVYMNV